MANIGNFPTVPAPREINIESIQQTLSNISLNMNVQKSTRRNQRWGLKYIYAPLTMEQYKTLWIFINQLQGQYNTCKLTVPHFGTTGSYNTTKYTAGKVSRTVNNKQVNLYNFQDTFANKNATTISGLFKAGDYIRFSGHNKTYLITEDADLGAYNDTDDLQQEVTIKIEPELIVQPQANETFVVDGSFIVALKNDVQNSSMLLNRTHSVALDFIEDVT